MVPLANLELSSRAVVPDNSPSVRGKSLGFVRESALFWEGLVRPNAQLPYSLGSSDVPKPSVPEPSVCDTCGGRAGSTTPAIVKPRARVRLATSGMARMPAALVGVTRTPTEH